MPLSFARKLLHILLLSRYSFTLDSNGFLDPLNGLDAAPPISLATAENGITGNLVAASNTGLTGEPITDPQASNLFNSQANPDTLSQLREGNPSPCVPKTDMSPNKRRRGKREKNYCDSNLLLAPGAGKKPTGPTGSQDHESGEQQTDGSSERESGKKPSSSGQDEKQEPSADTKAGPNDNSPCNDEEFIHALCGPLSASWQIRSINAQTFRFMLGAGNIYAQGFPPGCLEPDVAWCCKRIASRSMVLPTYEAYLLVGVECLPQEVVNFMRNMFGF